MFLSLSHVEGRTSHLHRCTVPPPPVQMSHPPPLVQSSTPSSEVRPGSGDGGTRTPDPRLSVPASRCHVLPVGEGRRRRDRVVTRLTSGAGPSSSRGASSSRKPKPDEARGEGRRDECAHRTLGAEVALETKVPLSPPTTLEINFGQRQVTTVVPRGVDLGPWILSTPEPSVSSRAVPPRMSPSRNFLRVPKDSVSVPSPRLRSFAEIVSGPSTRVCGTPGFRRDSLCVHSQRPLPPGGKGPFPLWTSKGDAVGRQDRRRERVS